MILSNKQIIKALIRLCRCAGWSAPLLFANTEDRFSHVEAQIACCMLGKFSCFCCHLLTFLQNYFRNTISASNGLDAVQVMLRLSAELTRRELVGPVACFVCVDTLCPSQQFSIILGYFVG